MDTKCYSMVRGKVARFTMLDHRGAPVEGDRSVVVTSGIIKAAISEIVEDQSNELVRNDNDFSRVLIRGKPRTMGYGVDLDLCGVDPDLISILTGQPVVLNATGDVSGNDFLSKMPVSNFAMEIWSKLDVPVDGYQYGYTLFPRLRGGRMSSLNYTNTGVDLTVGAAKTYRMSRWGYGPYSLRWSGDGWDMSGWDESGWDESAVNACLARVVTPTGPVGLGFGVDPFGSSPFGGTPTPVDPIYPRLGKPIGSHTHWTTFLLDSAPVPQCGAQALYDSIDGGSSSYTSVDVVDGGSSSYTSDDGVDGGWS
jgi:hypothetical protein